LRGGNQFLERVHNCADREDAVVKSPERADTGKGLCHEKVERMAWYSIEVEV